LPLHSRQQRLLIGEQCGCREPDGPPDPALQEEGTHRFLDAARLKRVSAQTRGAGPAERQVRGALVSTGEADSLYQQIESRCEDIGRQPHHEGVVANTERVLVDRFP
jgi:hypothetical protein